MTDNKDFNEKIVGVIKAIKNCTAEIKKQNDSIKELTKAIEKHGDILAKNGAIIDNYYSELSYSPDFVENLYSDNGEVVAESKPEKGDDDLFWIIYADADEAHKALCECPHCGYRGEILSFNFNGLPITDISEINLPSFCPNCYTNLKKPLE